MNRSRTPRPHVVVVDDDCDHCVLLALRLEHHGYRVTTEQTARAALEVLEREIVDAMIVDVRLDQEDGLDLLVNIQCRSLDLPVIMLTAHGSIETAVEAMKRGAYGFLTKPFDDHELLQKLEHAVERIQLRREVAGLRRIVGSSGSEPRLLGASAQITAVRDIIARIASADATVLVLGESGTGKEVAARCIHALSSRRDAPFIAINCGALPADLLESELFGHKRGAFTGAVQDKLGLFGAAHQGTMLLDEIGDAPASVQVKLLRVLQERSYLPVGASTPVKTDVRVIAATNRDIRSDVAEGRFREDLFYRLHVVPLAMPPLRERPEDIPLLAELFLSQTSAKHGLTTPHLSHDALQLLLAHPWPGNVRELANVIEGATLLTTDGVLRTHHVFAVLPHPSLTELASRRPPPTLDLPQVLLGVEELPPMREARERFDRAYLSEALRRAAGNVSAAAKVAGRNRTDFHDLLRRHGIEASEFRP
ncbi:sigma-54-dependent transcriptional regulator [Enhygromyxa salina]|uniref:Transcriptional regulatory protein QseF n=1 Tax=Enhygromyxa salina TaxID=215803 RepID=A0A2S9XPP5_9BACT|nr:sigma-54 dependent transcriptional regulator [Enhygromyxa salina]PRP94833.1 Transcriptional regulatory protein QseF [Enhygromyxa salina]